MKKVKMFQSVSHFEEFVNRADIETLDIDIKVVEQSEFFQECFCAVVFYAEVTPSAYYNSSETAFGDNQDAFDCLKSLDKSFLSFKDVSDFDYFLNAIQNKITVYRNRINS